jgi:hypothetical protein
MHTGFVSSHFTLRGLNPLASILNDLHNTVARKECGLLARDISTLHLWLAHSPPY